MAARPPPWERENQGLRKRLYSNEDRERMATLAKYETAAPARPAEPAPPKTALVDDVDLTSPDKPRDPVRERSEYDVDLTSVITVGTQEERAAHEAAVQELRALIVNVERRGLALFNLAALQDYPADHPAVVERAEQRFASDTYADICDALWKSRLRELKGRALGPRGVLAVVRSVVLTRGWNFELAKGNEKFDAIYAVMKTVFRGSPTTLECKTLLANVLEDIRGTDRRGKSGAKLKALEDEVRKLKDEKQALEDALAKERRDRQRAVEETASLQERLDASETHRVALRANIEALRSGVDEGFARVHELKKARAEDRAEFSATQDAHRANFGVERARWEAMLHESHVNAQLSNDLAVTTQQRLAFVRQANTAAPPPSAAPPPPAAGNSQNATNRRPPPVLRNA